MPPKQILIIDDENDIQEVTRLSLQLTESWTVIGANSGAAGALLALSECPDAILLDVMMPDMDGPSTLRVLQQQKSTIPVIFLTAKVQLADREKYMQLGVRGIISKPFDPLTLGQQIREMLAWE
ncbi:MAG: response regulator [Acidobacteria bacterium]|nr:response regulator [Acidobacteriota bacterium]MBV9070143.1 response regulator [Acidobacteriota bacterium]MBV9186318.1 response regulator [Acidobacteriota bacterium]